MYLEIRNNNGHCFGVVRSSYRKAGKVLHRNHGTLWNIPYETLKLIQLSFKNETIPKKKISERFNPLNMEQVIHF